MASWMTSIDPQIVVIVGAIAVTILSLRLLFQILRAGFGTMVTILAVVLILNYAFGISPQKLWFEMGHLPQDLAQWAKTFT